jgi:glycosyltransferase involved in cell wall biosynthesis
MTLGGTMFVFNGEKYDYNYMETIQCLQYGCDQVVVCVINSDDGTLQNIRSVVQPHTKVIVVDDEMWNLLSGKERLAYFSNIAIANLDTDYNLYIQADEILHEDSFAYARQAIQTGIDAFMCSRFNLWNTPYQMLNVPHDRKPCSSEVIRLARSKFRCYGDAESLAIDGKLSFEFINFLNIYHMGFVRKMDVMKQKVVHMQENVFQTPHDTRLDVADKYIPMDYFTESDLVAIPKPLPIFIQKWAKERYDINGIKNSSRSSEL